MDRAPPAVVRELQSSEQVFNFRIWTESCIWKSFPYKHPVQSQKVHSQKSCIFYAPAHPEEPEVLSCSEAENPHKPPLPELHLWHSPRTHREHHPSSPCLLLPLLWAPNTSKSDKKGKAWAQNGTGGIKADGPDNGPFGQELKDKVK